MKVTVKDLSAVIELKNNGMELEIRDPSDKFLGDLVVTRSQLIWCNGKKGRANGSAISLSDFIKFMNERDAAAKAKPAKKAVAKPAKKAPVAKKVAPVTAVKRILRTRLAA